MCQRGLGSVPYFFTNSALRSLIIGKFFLLAWLRWPIEPIKENSIKMTMNMIAEDVSTVLRGENYVGCVIPRLAPSCCGGEFTQPSFHLLAEYCTGQGWEICRAPSILCHFMSPIWISNVSCRVRHLPGYLRWEIVLVICGRLKTALSLLGHAQISHRK